MLKSLITTGVALLALAAAPARAGVVSDLPNDFLPTYTGALLPDLDVTAFSVAYDTATTTFYLTATLNGAIDPSTPGVYVIGANTGTGTIRPFAGIGQGNVIFNQAIIVNKNGTGNVGATSLTSGISIFGDTFTVKVPLAALPSTGFTPLDYGFNLWPRIATGGPVGQISDFSPENATLNAVPEPASWAMMIAGFALVGTGMRSRRRVTGLRFA